MKKLNLQNKPIIMWATGTAGLIYLLIWVAGLVVAFVGSYADDNGSDWFIVPWVLFGPILLVVYGMFAGLFAWLMVGLYRWSVIAVVIGAVLSAYWYARLALTAANMVSGFPGNDGSQLYWLGGSLFIAIVAAYYDLKYRRPKAGKAVL